MRKKNRIKHPLILYMGLALIPFIGGTIMLFLDKYLNLAEYVNLIVGISLGVYALGWLILFFKNFSKIISREEKTKITKYTNTQTYLLLYISKRRKNTSKIASIFSFAVNPKIH